MRPCTECQREVGEDARFCPFCGAASAAAEPADPMVGATVSGKFKVERLIGQGGMGRVYLARHLALDRPVVLKMLHRAYADDPQVVARFQREARAASRLNHPNSIAVLDFGAAADGTLYMAMEHLAGRDLSRVIADERPLSEARIVRIGAQVLAALAEAHALGIIHRDLKPENVMVEPRRDEPDFVKVLDFGIAKITAAAEDEPRLTQAGLVCGTPEYMSPEQARGAELDPRSDLYSVGVVLYQLATGELPFHSETPVGFLTKHLVEVPLPPRQRRPEVSVRLDAVIRRAMEKAPASRFADATAMREALLACAPPRAAAPAADAGAPARTSVGAPAMPPSQVVEGPGRAPPPAAARPGSRRSLLIASGVVVVAVVVALAAGGALLGTRREPLGTPARLVASPAAPGSATAPPGSPPPVAPAAAPAPAPAAAAAQPARPARPAASSPDRAHAKALVARGDAARGRQDLDGAIRAYLAAEAADPLLAELQKKLGLCYQQQGRDQEAAARYRRYLATHPPDAARVEAILSTLQ